MKRPLADRIPFAKIVTILAVTFGVALGLCGMTVLVSSNTHLGGSAMMPLGVLELVVMVLSAAGLVLTTIAWVIASALGGFRRRERKPVKLPNGEDDAIAKK
jgi:hypothetical protein